MDVVFLIGRILFVLIFVTSGVNHITQRTALAAYARQYKSPAPDLLVPLSGVGIVVAGLAIGFGVLADVAALGLIFFLLPAAFFMHAFWKEEDEQMQQNQLAHFSKNVALAGAALIIFYAYNQLQGDADLSLTDPLFNRG